MDRPAEPRRPRQVIGILGGLGPYAHLRLEESLLDAARRLAGARADQNFPPWVLCSLPGTPDRTRALVAEGPSPVPALLDGLQRLARAGADFALIPCITSHAWLPELRAGCPLEILSLPALLARRVAAVTPGGRIGLLATTGALHLGVLHSALEAEGLRTVSPLDLPDGDALQTSRVMAAIYGRGAWPQAEDEGIKATGPLPRHRELLAAATRELTAAGPLDGVVAGCTEIGLAFAGATALAGVRLHDPMVIAAEAAVRRAYGLAGGGEG